MTIAKAAAAIPTIDPTITQGILSMINKGFIN